MYILQRSVIYAKFFANSTLGKIFRKTSNLGENFAEDDITGKNLQNIMGFGWKFEKKCEI